jgi:hypothetical protein
MHNLRTRPLLYSLLVFILLSHTQTGTSLTTNKGFEIYEVTQPNVAGQFALSDEFTPSHFTAQVANQAIQRLVSQSDPWFLTVSFHNPHPPMVAASKYLDNYWNSRDQLFLSPNMNDDLSNSAYGNIVGKIPDYQVSCINISGGNALPLIQRGDDGCVGRM